MPATRTATAPTETHTAELPVAARVSVRACEGDGSSVTPGVAAAGVPAPGAGVEGCWTEGVSAGAEGAGTPGAGAEGCWTEGVSAGTEGAGTPGAGTPGAGTEGCWTEGVSAGAEGAGTPGAGTEGCWVGWPIDGFGTFCWSAGLAGSFACTLVVQALSALRYCSAVR